MTSGRGFIWFMFTSLFMGLMWLVFKPVWNLLNTTIAATVPDATTFELLLFTAAPFIIFGGLGVYIIIRVTRSFSGREGL